VSVETDDVDVKHPPIQAMREKSEGDREEMSPGGGGEVLRQGSRGCIQVEGTIGLHVLRREIEC
jgi:hypothetical protein